MVIIMFVCESVVQQVMKENKRRKDDKEEDDGKQGKQKKGDNRYRQTDRRKMSTKRLRLPLGGSEPSRQGLGESSA